MFQFDSFHMYGIIMTAIVTGVIGIQYIKKNNIKDFNGNAISIPDKDKGTFRYWIGGLFFGLGWALVGACPGPIFILIGAGYVSILVVFAGALIGTFLYGILEKKLPH
jgi:uncharacterized membrane protein YedE/YeeE